MAQGHPLGQHRFAVGVPESTDPQGIGAPLAFALQATFAAISSWYSRVMGAIRFEFLLGRFMLWMIRVMLKGVLVVALIKFIGGQAAL